MLKAAKVVKASWLGEMLGSILVTYTISKRLNRKGVDKKGAGDRLRCHA
jgi:hypothetical protein